MTRLVTMLLVLLLWSSPAQAQGASWFGRDKAQHFGASFAIASGGYGLGAGLFEARGHRLLLGGLMGAAAGSVKELLDLAGFGTPDWRDLLWDAIGVVFGLVVAWAFDVCLNAGARRQTERNEAAFARPPPPSP